MSRDCKVKHNPVVVVARVVMPSDFVFVCDYFTLNISCILHLYLTYIRELCCPIFHFICAMNKQDKSWF